MTQRKFDSKRRARKTADRDDVPERGRQKRNPAGKNESPGRGYRSRTPYRGSSRASEDTTAQSATSLRLNKFIAHAGVCSRREADEYIKAGKVRVNGKVCKEMGVQVNPADRITVDGQSIKPEPFEYILMNKPRDTITTTSDERGRRTVMDLIEDATGLRLYPVGRLDRNTTGLILLTNDGDLANRLMHPSYKVRKVYEVETNRELTDDELTKIRTGIALEDGPAKAYRASRHPQYLNMVTLSMHEGRNHIVRRMVDALGAEVVRLDRVGYGPLQKKGLRTGRWRKLRKHEINELRKMVKLLPLEQDSRS
ncbi:pseudouridine synthase [Balneolales bacterium ANBcel1]|nr:pseudouridine synthase [Balneolales bacterium ANBcel1]